MKFNKQFDLFNFSFYIIKNEKDFYVDFLYKSTIILMLLKSLQNKYLDLTILNTNSDFILFSISMDENFCNINFIDKNIYHRVYSVKTIFGVCLEDIKAVVRNIRTKNYIYLTVYNVRDCLVLFPIFIYYMITINKKEK